MPPLLLGPEIAVIGTLVALMAAVFLGWVLQNRQFPGRSVVRAAGTAMLALPAPLLCYYLLAELGHIWPLTPLGMTFAAVLSTFPMLLRSTRFAFAALDHSYARAARTLGASEFRVFSRVELPLVWRPVARASALALARVLLELTAAFWIADVRV